MYKLAGRFLTLTLSASIIAVAEPVAGQNARATDGSGRTSASRTVRQAVALRVEGAAPSIDGRLDEAVWATARAATDFVQMRPTPGAQSSARTEARVLYDDDAIYVGIRLFDAPDSVAAQLTRRDATGAFTDWVHVLIDSYHDRRTAFRFSLTPRGAKKDVLHFNDSGEDVNWDAVWDGAAVVDAEGWTAEMRIPLSQLRFAGNPGGDLVWGINFSREIARRAEWSSWSPVLPEAGGLVSQAGELTQLTNLRPPRRFEIVPYTLARLEAAPADPGNPFYERRAESMNVGADVRIGVGSNLTLSSTFNPDFGQVEADPSVVNLTANETFYPEKRPFFTEGSNIFGFKVGIDEHSGEGLFYSRRIGREPQRFVRPPGSFVDRPETANILGAAKLSGRTAGGWTIGVLNAVTAAEEARLARPGEPDWTEPVEPATNYAVTSLSRDFNRGQSAIGFMGTAVNRSMAGGEFAFLRSAAYALGMNGRHRFAQGSWETTGYIAGSHIRGSETALLAVQQAPGHYYQRPDADHLEIDPTRTSLSGVVANFTVGRIAGGGPWRGGVNLHLRTPGLELNDVGYMQQADQFNVSGNLRYHLFEPRGIFRSFSISLNPSAAWSTGGENTSLQLGTYANFDFTNLWNGWLWVARRFESLGTDAMRGGPGVLRPAAVTYIGRLSSDQRHVLTGALNASGGFEDQGGSWNTNISTTLSLRPSSQLTLSAGPGIGLANNGWQYIGQPTADGTRRYVVGRLDQTTVSLTARANYTMSPTLSFELYAQPFISGGEYSEFRTLGQPRDHDFDRRFVRIADNALSYDATARRYNADVDGNGSFETGFANPDFNFRQMRGNAVLRWEYRPGSTLYLVWGQSRTAYLQGEPGSPFALGRDAGRLFNNDAGFPTPVTNVFILKLSYWLNP